jgi:DNA polymerase III epsilon subunit-like protein
MRWTERTIVAFDNETTGFHSEAGDRVIEFGAAEIRVNERLEILSCTRHEWLIDPGIPLSSDTTRVTGIKQEDVEGKPSFEKLAVRIHALLAGAGTLVAHNFAFDRRFLLAEFARCGLSWPHGPLEVDTYDIARKVNLKTEANNLKLGTIVAHLGIPLVEAHRAAHDAEACGRALVVLAQRYQAPQDTAAFVNWANGLDPVPPNPHVGVDGQGRIVFLDGAHAGTPVEQLPDVLQWMGFARERLPGVGWQWRFPEELRGWIQRFLRFRCSGAFPAGLKGIGPGDWGIDLPVGVEAGPGGGP